MPTLHDALTHDARLIGAIGELSWTWDDLFAWASLKCGFEPKRHTEYCRQLLATWEAVNGKRPTLLALRAPYLPPPPLPEESVLRRHGIRLPEA